MQATDAISNRSFPDPVVYQFAQISRQLINCDSREAFLSGPGGDAIVAEIEKDLHAVKAELLSFDVFDTFLLRNDKPELMRFLELSRLIHQRLSAARKGQRVPTEFDLLFARLQAMEISYRTRKAVDGCREGHISDVVRTIGLSLGLEEGDEALLLEAEQDYEVENLAMNPALLKVATNFKASGGKVILVSDMYLGRNEIEAIIRRLNRGALEVIDSIFSSADTVVSKRSGKIFGYLTNKFGVAEQRCLHIGDALDGDVFKCRNANWHALHFPVSQKEAVRRHDALTELGRDLSEQGFGMTRWTKT